MVCFFRFKIISLRVLNQSHVVRILPAFRTFRSSTLFGQHRWATFVRKIFEHWLKLFLLHCPVVALGNATNGDPCKRFVEIAYVRFAMVQLARIKWRRKLPVEQFHPVDSVEKFVWFDSFYPIRSLVPKASVDVSLKQPTYDGLRLGRNSPRERQRRSLDPAKQFSPVLRIPRRQTS